MTISITVSVNGNYKVPVTTKYGDNDPQTEVISGRGHEGPFRKDIPYYHGSNPSNVVVVTVGPEEQDNGWLLDSYSSQGFRLLAEDIRHDYELLVEQHATLVSTPDVYMERMGRMASLRGVLEHMADIEKRLNGEGL